MQNGFLGLDAGLGFRPFPTPFAQISLGALRDSQTQGSRALF
jgi:hypothetical protein